MKHTGFPAQRGFPHSVKLSQNRTEAIRTTVQTYLWKQHTEAEG